MEKLDVRRFQTVPKKKQYKNGNRCTDTNLFYNMPTDKQKGLLQKLSSHGSTRVHQHINIRAEQVV